MVTWKHAFLFTFKSIAVLLIFLILVFTFTQKAGDSEAVRLSEETAGNDRSPAIRHKDAISPLASTDLPSARIDSEYTDLSEERKITPIFFGIDLSPGSEKVILELTPPGDRINHGKPITIRFYPGPECDFGDKQACIFTFELPLDSTQPDQSTRQVILLSVHSGVGGQAQKFRHIIEGTGFNSTGYNLKKVSSIMGYLIGAKVKITQGDRTVDNLELAGLGRVPAKSVHEYFTLRIEDAFRFASSFNASLAQVVNQASPAHTPLLVIETCGWKMPGEKWAKDVTATTGSIYLGLIQETKQ